MPAPAEVFDLPAEAARGDDGWHDAEADEFMQNGAGGSTMGEPYTDGDDEGYLDHADHDPWEDTYQVGALAWLRRMRTVLAGGAAACLAAFVALTVVALNRPGEGFDRAFYDVAPGFDLWNLARVLILVRAFGNELIAGPIALVAFIWAYRSVRLRPHAVYGMAVFLSGVLVATVLKVLLGQPGPPVWDTGIPDDPHMALPSGHTVIASLLFGVLALHAYLVAPRMRLGMTILFAEMALGVGLAQALLKIHWLSDVLAAWLFAGAWLLLATALAPRFLGTRGPAAAVAEAAAAEAAWDDQWADHFEDVQDEFDDVAHGQFEDNDADDASVEDANDASQVLEIPETKSKSVSPGRHRATPQE